MDRLYVDFSRDIFTLRMALVREAKLPKSMAVTSPEVISSTILNDIGPVIDTQGLDVIMGYIGRRPSFATYDEAAAGLEKGWAPAFANVPVETWDATVRRLYKESPDGLDLRYDPKLRDAVLAQAESGPTAIEFLKINEVDLVFLDINMPGMNGFEFLQKVEDYPFLTIITTAYDRYALKAIKYSAMSFAEHPAGTSP